MVIVHNFPVLHRYEQYIIANSEMALLVAFEHFQF